MGKQTEPNVVVTKPEDVGSYNIGWHCGSRLILGGMRLASLCLLVSAVFLPVSRAQAPAGPQFSRLRSKTARLSFS
jgi:hypothetical protein